MATIWKFRNSDDNFKKLLSVFTQMFIHFVWEGIAKTLDTSQNLLLVFTERWIHVQEFHHIRISFSEGNFKKPLLVFLVCPLFYLLLSNVFTGYPSTPTLQACPLVFFCLGDGISLTASAYRGIRTNAPQRNEILRHSDATKAMRGPQRRARCRATKFLGMCEEGNAQPAAAYAPHSNEIH